MENRMEPEKKMAENGEGEKHELENNNFKKKKKKRREVGGIKTMPFILGEVSGFTCSNQSFCFTFVYAHFCWENQGGLELYGCS